MSLDAKMVANNADDELMKSFLLEIDSSTKSNKHITKEKYHFVLFHFWKIIANTKFQTDVKSLTKIQLRLIRNEMQTMPRKDLVFHVKEKNGDLPYEPKSIINYFSVLSSYYEFLIEEKILTENPTQNIRMPPITTKNVVFLTDTEIMNLVRDLTSKIDNDRVDYYQEVLIMLLPLSTGLRVSEQSELNIDAIDIKTGEVRILGKGSKLRTSYIPTHDVLFMRIYEKFLEERKKRLDHLISELSNKIDQLKHKNKDYAEFEERREQILKNRSLFNNRNGDRLSTRDIQRRVKKYRELFQIEKHLTPHKLRHSFASKLVRENIDIFMIKELLGHTKITTTEIYLHANSDILQAKMHEKKPFNFNFSDEKKS
jgi:site-specific recombinase XerD